MKCTFCGNTLEPGTGKMFIKNDGKILYFCSRKCEKNMLVLKRDFKKVKWARKTKEKNK